MRQIIISITKLKKEIELAKGNLLQVLTDISFDVKQQEFVSIVGPSGSGKTTLLHCISSLLPPTEGEVMIDGESPYGWSAAKLAKFRRKKNWFYFSRFSTHTFIVSLR